MKKGIVPAQEVECLLRLDRNIKSETRVHNKRQIPT